MTANEMIYDIKNYNMPTIPFLQGNYEIQELSHELISHIRSNPLSGSASPYFSIIEQGYHINPSTVWSVFVEDIEDGSLNLIRFEPKSLLDSPVSDQPLPMPLTVFNTSPNTTRGNNFVLFFTMTEDPRVWHEKECSEQLALMLEREFIPRARDYITRAGGDFDRILKSSYHFAFFGISPQFNKPGGFIVLSQKDVLSLDKSDPFFERLERHQQELAIKGISPSHKPHRMKVRTICSTCEIETEFMPVNFRNQNGDYLAGHKSCVDCGAVLNFRSHIF